MPRLGGRECGLHGVVKRLVVGDTRVVVVHALRPCSGAGGSVKERVAQGIQGEQHLTGVRRFNDLGDIGVPIPVGLKKVVPLVGLLGKVFECG